MEQSIDEMITWLALMRADLRNCQEGQRQRLERVMKSDDYLSNQESIDDLRRAIRETEAKIEAAVMSGYLSEGAKNHHPAVTVEMFTVVQYEPNDARKWCFEHLPGALKLDKEYFERHAKAAQDPLAFVTVIQEPRMQIAQDLSPFEQRNWAAVDDAKGIEAEIPY